MLTGKTPSKDSESHASKADSKTTEKAKGEEKSKDGGNAKSQTSSSSQRYCKVLLKSLAEFYCDFYSWIKKTSILLTDSKMFYRVALEERATR